jgi:hypothetical protein
VTPDPTPIERFVDWWMTATYELDSEMRASMLVHDAWWGVHLGPTLSMAHPPKLRGILLEATQ